jgi:hypothetical protein
MYIMAKRQSYPQSKDEKSLGYTKKKLISSFNFLIRRGLIYIFYLNVNFLNERISSLFSQTLKWAKNRVNLFMA